jgi:hypothetical protein
LVLPSSFVLLLRIETAGASANLKEHEPRTASTIRAESAQRKKKHRKARIDAASSSAQAEIAIDANIGHLQRRASMACFILGVHFFVGAHMANWKELEKQFAARLSMSCRPVAVTFLDAEPAGIAKFSGSEPAGCSFWRVAAAGRAFYTLPADHFNCAVGAYTHNVQLLPERVQ